MILTWAIWSFHGWENSRSLIITGLATCWWKSVVIINFHCWLVFLASGDNWAIIVGSSSQPWWYSIIIVSSSYQPTMIMVFKIEKPGTPREGPPSLSKNPIEPLPSRRKQHGCQIWERDTVAMPRERLHHAASREALIPGCRAPATLLGEAPAPGRQAPR
jgi:hypothetical protein